MVIWKGNLYRQILEHRAVATAKSRSGLAYGEPSPIGTVNICFTALAALMIARIMLLSLGSVFRDVVPDESHLCIWSRLKTR